MLVFLCLNSSSRWNEHTPTHTVRRRPVATAHASSVTKDSYVQIQYRHVHGHVVLYSGACVLLGNNYVYRLVSAVYVHVIAKY